MTTVIEPAASGTLASLTDLINRRTPGYSLEAPFYTDREIFETDLRDIFAQHWIFVATEAEIREPGDFVTLDLGSYAIIVLRDDDGIVRAMHNVCRHRGARVLTEARGSVGNLVCGYHQWTYATDGRLLTAGQQRPGFDKSCFGLKQIHARAVGGLIFICLAQDPPADFDDVAQRLAPYLEPHQLRRTKVAHQVELIEAANWKLVMENNRECYHCDGAHPELTCTFFPTYGYALEDIPPRLMPAHARFMRAEGELHRTCAERGYPYELIEELRGKPTGFRIAREALDGAGESYTRDGSAASTRLLGEIDTPRLGRLSLHQQPNTWAHFQADHAVVFSVIPVSVDHTLVRTTWLVHEDAQEGVDYDLHNLTEVWIATNEQDAALTSRAQAGVSSPAYEPGPYAPSEYQVNDFVTWYLERIAAATAMQPTDVQPTTTISEVTP